jgi:hypothetical protein
LFWKGILPIEEEFSAGRIEFEEAPFGSDPKIVGCVEANIIWHYRLLGGQMAHHFLDALVI